MFEYILLISAAFPHRPFINVKPSFFVFQQRHGQRASNRTSFNSKLECVEHHKHSARRVLFSCFIPAFDGRRI
jgi:hypothetical protein